jgi:AraC family transcriptional regulator
MPPGGRTRNARPIPKRTPDQVSGGGPWDDPAVSGTQRIRSDRVDRLRQVLDAVLASLDEPVDRAAVASRAFVSPFHFDHLFRAALGEPPLALRRRVLLERAAYTLRTGRAPITSAALDAGYDWPEAFSRAFRRSYGESPRSFRTSDRSFRLPAPNGIHFHPPGGLLVPAPSSERSHVMDLTDRLLEQDLWHARRLLAAAAALDDEQLDRELPIRGFGLPIDSAAPTVRSMLDRLIWTKEMWTAAIDGRELPAQREPTIRGLSERLEEAGPAFIAAARAVDRERAWDTTFIDATCDPPEQFSFGGMVAHVLTFSAARRMELVRSLRLLGTSDQGYGDPFEWEEQRLDEA